MSTCVVLGNGPSLKGFDLHRLAGIPSLGMNAAYRYWREIDWYPTYYACLDDQLIHTHHDEIYKLWQEGRIKQFFLHSNFFEYHPDCINREGFYSLDQVLPHWYGKRGKGQGWQDLTQHPAFKTKDTRKVTTGAFATRFAIYQGHTEIALMGIDLKYVEILPEAESTSEIGLMMRETPKSNPNYFFDSYQQAGDRYNIPNPKAHENELHIQSFELIQQDYSTAGLEVDIYNTNINSLLQERKVFPLRLIDGLICKSALGAVVVPATDFEIDAILQNFEIWAQAEYAPIVAPKERDRCALVLVFNNTKSQPREAEIRAKFEASNLSRYFSRFDIDYLQLTGVTDAYQKDYSKKVGTEGFKSGPNNQFFQTMQRARKFGHFILQMETDCAPLRAGWLTALQHLADSNPDSWVIGSRYHGAEELDPAFRDHLNGNALYATGDPGFQTFLQTFWEPRCWDMVARVDRRLAYDCILEKIFTEQRDSDPKVAAVLRDDGHRFQATTVLINASGKSDIAAVKDDFRRVYSDQFPDAVLLHNRGAQVVLAAAVKERRALPAPRKITPSPRILVFDMTAAGHSSATGQVKSELFADWNNHAFLQIARVDADGVSVVRKTGSGQFQAQVYAMDAARGLIAAFDPDIVLYRPVPDTQNLHEFAMETIQRLEVPLATWLMDDWPAEMARTKPDQWKKLGPDLKDLLALSSLRLSICNAMSEAFEIRYGHEFKAFANGILPTDWPKPKSHDTESLLLRYAGGLAENMTRNSVLRIARAVETLADQGHDIRFEINTQKWWYDQSHKLFAGFKHTQIGHKNRSAADYRRWLTDADALVIAYNFDPDTLRYVQYSMANKMPECLASGAVLLAHGPPEIATISYLADSQAAAVVTEDDDEAVKTCLQGLLSNPARRTELAKAGHAFALRHHDIKQLRTALQAELTAAADQTRHLGTYRFLQQIAQDKTPANGSVFLTSAGSLLLLSPPDMVYRFRSNKTLAAAQDYFLQTLPDTNPLKAHYTAILDHLDPLDPCRLGPS